ncbi:MAG: hypothetical protein KIT14_18950 [bacterium]|nr:hypothetical protein [bacterium]
MSTTATTWAPWRREGWAGTWRPDAGVDLAAVLALVASGVGRTSRTRAASPATPAGTVWVK